MTDTRKHLLFLALACLLVYGNSLGNGFIWDDHSLVDGNMFLSDWRNIPKLFTTNLFAGRGGPSARAARAAYDARRDAARTRRHNTRGRVVTRRASTSTRLRNRARA